MSDEILMTAPMLPLVSDALEQAFTVHRLWDQPDRATFLAQVGHRIRGIATSTLYGRVDAGLMAHLPSLEIIASFGVGYDNVDAAEATRRGVVVTNTPGVLDDEVADFTIGLLLATLRRIPQADRYLREGHWRKRPFPLSPTLRGRSIGLVGLGRIGQAVAKRLAGFDIAIAYHARNRRDAVGYAYHPTLIGLAEASDVLIVVTPGGAETRHLIDATVLRALGPTGVLINVARGSVVDERALIEALRSGTIHTAGLDVYGDEPNVPAELVARDDVVLLPHIASGSVHTRNAMGQLVVDNLVSWFAGNGPMTPVPEAGVLLA